MIFQVTFHLHNACETIVRNFILIRFLKFDLKILIVQVDSHAGGVRYTTLSFHEKRPSKMNFYF